jgi:hypothetical protein
MFMAESFCLKGVIEKTNCRATCVDRQLRMHINRAHPVLCGSANLDNHLKVFRCTAVVDLDSKVAPLSAVSQHSPPLRGRASAQPSKRRREFGGIGVSDGKTDFHYRHARPKQNLRPLHSPRSQIFEWCASCGITKSFGKTSGRTFQLRCDFLHSNIRSQAVVDEFCGYLKLAVGQRLFQTQLRFRFVGGFQPMKKQVKAMVEKGRRQPVNFGIAPHGDHNGFDEMVAVQARCRWDQGFETANVVQHLRRSLRRYGDTQ